MAARLSLVAIGIGGVGIRRGMKRERIRTTTEIATKVVAGLLDLLATIRNTILAPRQKTRLKMMKMQRESFVKCFAMCEMITKKRTKK